MNRTVDISAVFPGTTQFSRALPALDPASFAVDERDVSDLLAFTAKFAKAIAYVDPQNKLQGNWQELLLSDPRVLLAYVSKTNTYLEFSKYLDYRDGILAATLFPTQLLFTQQFFSIGFHLILRMDRWYKLADQSILHTLFRDYLGQTIAEEGRAALQQYYQLYYRICENLPIFRNEALAKLEDLSPVWLFEPFPCPVKEIEKAKTAEDRIRSGIIAVIEEAVQAGQQLFHLQDRIIKSAQHLYEISLQQSDIAPHIGLLLTFLDLLQYPRSDLNRFTQNHLDFYYHSVLGLQTLPAAADTTFVTFQLAKGQDSFLLAEGSALAAGSGSDGKAVSFVTTAPVKLTAAGIKQYLTLNFQGGGTEGALGPLISGAFKKWDTLQAPGWPVFGAAVAAIPDYVVQENRDLGFAVSAPDLILNGGFRSITFSFYQNLATGPDNDEDNLAVTPSAAAEPLPPLFNFEVTTAKGWLAVAGNCVYSPGKSPALQWTLNFSAGDPAIAPYNAGLHGKGFSTQCPVCRAIVHPQIPKKTYQALRKFVFQRIEIDTVVQGLGNLVLQNDRGKISPQIIFPPFGNSPLPGAHCYVGQQELFVKPLSGLDLNILWDKLPDDLAAYYEGYRGNYDNQIFQAELSRFNSEGVWQALVPEGKDKPAQFPLFTTKMVGSQDALDQQISRYLSPEFPISNPRRVSFQGEDLLGYQPEVGPYTVYTKELNNAFLQLEFQAPSQGFGGEEYAKLLAQTTMENGQAVISNANSFKGSGKPAALKFCEALDAFGNQIEAFQHTYKGALYRLSSKPALLQDSVQEICELLALNEKAGGALKPQVAAALANWRDELATSLQKEQQVIMEVVGNVFTTTGQYLQAHAKELKDDMPTGGADLQTSQLPATSAKTLLGNLAKNAAGEAQLIDRIKDILQGILVAHATETTSSASGFLSFLRKKKRAAGTNVDDPLGINKIWKQVEDFYDGLIDEILAQFDTCITGVIQTTAICSQFTDCVSKVNGLLQEYLRLNFLFSFLFTKIEGYLPEWEKKLCNGYIAIKPLPNRPFVPKIKSLTVDYTSQRAWAAQAKVPGHFQYYHLEPFGVPRQLSNDAAISLLPDYDTTPYALLGFQPVKAGDLLTVFFAITSQLRSVSTEAGPAIKYQYLSEVGWLPIDPQSDSTYGLEQSGIVKFLVPEDFSEQSDSMPKGYFWLRIWQPPPKADPNAAADQASPANRIVMTNFLAAQAAVVERQLEGTNGFQPIPPGTIKSTAVPAPAIKKIIQPLASFGGRTLEDRAAFYQRVAYRLNHKNRAVLPADLENLVLQSFPSLFQAKALPMTYFSGVGGKKTKVVLVPWTRLSDEHPFRPLAAPALLREVLDYLLDHCPPALDLEVINPDFVELTLTIKVQYKRPEAEGQWDKQLNEELIRFLSPWLSDNPFCSASGKAWNEASVRAFVQSRPYVKQVELLQFSFQIAAEEALAGTTALPNQRPEAWQLVVPALQHKINQKTDGGNNPKLKPGLTIGISP